MLLISTYHRWGNWDTQMWRILPKVTEHLSRDRWKTRSWEKDPDIEETAGAKVARMGERHLWEEVHRPSPLSCCFPERRGAIGPALHELFSCPAHFPMSLDDKCFIPWHSVTSSSVLKCLTYMCDKGSIWSHTYLVASQTHHQTRESQWAHQFLLPLLSWSSWFGSLFGHWFHSAWYYQEWSVFLSLSDAQQPLVK